MTQTSLKTNDFFSTTDLALAAAISLRFPIEKIDKTDPYKAQFIFKRNEKLDVLVESFWRGSLNVNPLTYFNQLKGIKTRLRG